MDPLLHTGGQTPSYVQLNSAEAALFCSTVSDHSVCLYDLRAAVSMGKFLLPMKSNKLAWNPREPFNFVLANEHHHNLYYSFDMRNLSKPTMIHNDHVAAVIEVAFYLKGAVLNSSLATS